MVLTVEWKFKSSLKRVFAKYNVYYHWKIELDEILAYNFDS